MEPVIEFGPALDALDEVLYWFDVYSQATTPKDQANSFVILSSAVSDLKSWHPGYDVYSGTLPWEREDES